VTITQAAQTDHGALTGLADDDHTQYYLVNGTRVAVANFTSGTINGPIAAGGTWTAAATWTLPTFTLGGTVTLNGQSFSGTCANGGTFTTIDIDGGSIDGTAVNATTLSASGVTNLDAGTVAAPGLILESETGTGLYRIGANNHGYAVSGAKVLDISSTGLGVAGSVTTTGNVGVGVTPSAWDSSYKAIDINNNSVIYGFDSGVTAVGTNFYVAGGVFKYKNDSYAPAVYLLGSGVHQWYSAAAGTAGDAFTFTNTMTLDASGNLSVTGSVTADKSGKATLVLRDTTSYAAGVGASIDLGGNYRTAGDYQAFTRIAAEKANATDTDYGYNLGFYVTANGGATFGVKPVTISSTGLAVTGSVTPSADNTYDLGAAATGWREIFADNGTINTSDARRKTAISQFGGAEMEAAKDLSREIGLFQWLSAIETKGDSARLHVGLTVQRVIEVMESHGLDPFRYGFVCYDEWDDVFVEHPAIEAADAVLDEDGNIVTPAVEAREAWTEQTRVAGNLYSLRYGELTLFLARGIEARLTAAGL
jgi:hypothetical protein